MRRITAFAGALLCLFFTVSAEAAPRQVCNNPDIMRPCAPVAGNQIPKCKESCAGSVQSRRIARADRFRNVEFGSPMYPPETERSFLRGVSTPARFVGGRLKCAVNIGVAG